VTKNIKRHKSTIKWWQIYIFGKTNSEEVSDKEINRKVQTRPSAKFYQAKYTVCIHTCRQQNRKIKNNAKQQFMM